MMYRPSNSILERIRGLFKQRVGDAEFAYLGDSHGDGARVDVPGKIGFVYIHFPNGKDENGNALYSTPMIARATSVAYLNFPGAGVYVGAGYDGELEIKAAHYAGLDQAGVDTRVLNPLNQQSKFVYSWQLTYGLANAVATTLTGSFLVTVKSFLHYVGNTFQKYETPLQADKIDLASHVPGADEHRYAAIWIDTYTNTPTVTTSTTQPLDEPLDYTDIQELVTGRPADAMPLKAFYLSDDQSTLRQTAREVDLRQHMATPTPWGFPHALTSLERVRPNYTLVVGPYTASGGGALTIETGGRVLNVHKSNVSASAPTINDDSDDGYDIGSRWFNSTTDTLYVATDVTVGAAVWEPVGGGVAPFAPANATYLVQVANASLPNAQAMGALATGIVKNTTTTGVQSIAVAGTDYTSPTGIENLSNKTITASSINSTPIGATSPSTGAFTTLSATGDLTLSGAPGKIKPAANSTTALQITNAAGTAFVTFDTSNNRVGVNGTPARSLSVLDNSNPQMRLYNSTRYMDFFVDSNANLLLTSDAVSPSFGVSGSVNPQFRVTDSTTPSTGKFQATDSLILIGAETNTATAYITNNLQRMTIATGGEVNINHDTALTNQMANVFTISHNTSGTPASGFGSTIRFLTKSSTTNSQSMANIDAYWDVATHASRASQLDLGVYYTTTKQVAFSARGDTGGIKSSVNGVAPVAPQTYGVPTGTITRTTFDTTTVTLAQLAERVYALIVDHQAFGTLK
jgi:hypothetical protein